MERGKRKLIADERKKPLGISRWPLGKEEMENR